MLKLFVYKLYKEVPETRRQRWQSKSTLLIALWSPRLRLKTNVCGLRHFSSTAPWTRSSQKMQTNNVITRASSFPSVSCHENGKHKPLKGVIQLMIVLNTQRTRMMANKHRHTTKHSVSLSIKSISSYEMLDVNRCLKPTFLLIRSLSQSHLSSNFFFLNFSLWRRI